MAREEPELAAGWTIAGAMAAYAAVLAGILWLRSGWAAILGYHLAMVAAIAASGRSGVWRLTVRGRDAAVLAALAVPCAAVGPVVWLLWPVAGLEDLRMVDGLGALGLGGSSWVGFVVYYSLANPVIEETFWRGWFAETSRWPAPSDVLYAGYHAVVLWIFLQRAWIALALAVLVGAGWAWRRAALRTGGLLVPVATHLVADVSVVAAAVSLAAAH
jgi:membrane protease YdiL (CAAX protease family)